MIPSSCPRVITVVIPTLNEEGAIARTIDGLPTNRLKRHGFDTQVIVIDGNSVDRTRKIAWQRGAEVIIEGRRGYGIPIRTGLNAAKGDYVVKGDGDDTYPLDALPELMTIVEHLNLDFLTTDRFSQLNHRAMTPRNRFGNRVLSILVRILFGVRLKDTQSGMWILRADILQNLILKRNVSFSQELKIEATCFARLRWAEVPIAYRPRVGKAKFGTFWVGIKLVMSLFLLKFRITRKRSPTSI
jgi:glycosyltransferase involved in cell wall biosynthesis